MDGCADVFFVIRQSDPKQAYYALEAREFLRKRLIGKHVKVQVDFIRPREGEYDERECATVRYGNQQSYVPFLRVAFKRVDLRLGMSLSKSLRRA